MKQLGNATTTGGMCCWPISRSSRSGRFSRKPTQFVWDRPLLVKPMVDELRTLFGRAGTAGEIELYPGVHHGFAFPQRWCYDKPAAERHWERLIALYRRRLG